MALTESEIRRVRYFLGRAARNEDSREWPLMRVDNALGQLTPEDEEIVRSHIQGLEALHGKLLSNTNCANVSAVGDAQFDPDRAVRIIRAEGLRLTRALAEWLGVALYNSPFGAIQNSGLMRR